MKEEAMRIRIDEEIELKQLQEEDASAIFRIIDAQREYLGKWLPFVEWTKEVADTERFVDSIVNATEDRFEYVFTIRSQNVLIGLISFKDTDRFIRKTEIGYWLSDEHQGQGIMTKATKSLCQLAFTKLNINRIQIKCAVGNEASKRIPKRLGFQFEGIERQGGFLNYAGYLDLEVYSKLKGDL